MYLYFKRTREATIEYVRAKTVLDDIILSFNKDLKMQEEDIRDVADGSKKASLENRQIIEEIKSEISEIMNQLMNLTKTKKSLLDNYDVVQKNVDDLMSQRMIILEKLRELKSSKDTVELADTTIKLAIPIRKEDALAPLTETELKILNLLAIEGNKTAPQIKGRIHLTREHTARLMKKLFSDGYVERKTSKIPYVYLLNKEMEELLGTKRAIN
jgi:hypothetical protein